MVEQLTLYSLAVLAIYIVVMLYLGYRGYKMSSGSMEEYTLARGKLGPITIGVAYSATLASTVTFIGIPGWGYTAGLSSLWFSFMYWGPAMASTLVIAKMFRRMGVRQGSLSLPEWIGNRYGKDYLTIIFGVLVLSNILYIGAQFVGLAIIFEYIIGIPFQIGILGALVIVIVYTFLGGTYTDVMTDFLQGILMVIISVTVLGSIFWVFGGFSELVSQLEAQSALLVAPTNPEFPIFAGPLPIIAIAMFGFIVGFQPQLTNKYLTLDSEKDIKLFVISAATSNLLFFLVIIAGPAAKAINPGLESPDAATLVYLIDAFPPIITAIFGTALLSAGISTTDGLIVSVGTAMGNDIYRSVLADTENVTPEEQNRIERRSILITRVVVIAVGIVAAMMVMSNPPSFIATFASIGILVFVSAAFPPTFLGVFWQGGTAKGALASAIVGPAVLLLWQLGIVQMGISSLFVAGAVATFSAVIAMVVVSFFTESVSITTIDEALD